MKVYILRILTLPFFLFALVSHGQSDHSLWNNILNSHVSQSGKVNYRGIKGEQENLNQYLSELASNKPSGNANDQLAYWINAYNAYTVKLIIDHMPVSSIKDIAVKVETATPWDYEFARIGGATYSLNQIEHEIIRVQFNEPRIHFAVNCASKSCPKLRNEAFRGDILDAQLTEQTRDFILDKTKNDLSSSPIKISQLFDWYKGDFTKEVTLIEFLNKYSQAKIADSDTPIYLEYSWKLNH